MTRLNTVEESEVGPATSLIGNLLSVFGVKEALSTNAQNEGEKAKTEMSAIEKAFDVSTNFIQQRISDHVGYIQSTSGFFMKNLIMPIMDFVYSAVGMTTPSERLAESRAIVAAAEGQVDQRQGKLSTDLENARNSDIVDNQLTETNQAARNYTTNTLGIGAPQVNAEYNNSSAQLKEGTTLGNDGSKPKPAEELNFNF